MTQPLRDLVAMIDRDPKSERRTIEPERCSICQTIARIGNWCGVCGQLGPRLGIIMNATSASEDCDG